MKYTKDERLNIGRRIYDGQISRYQAVEEYDIGIDTARDYMRLYRDSNQLPPKHNVRNSHIALCPHTTPASTEEFEAMTKEELIQELVKARITEARLKMEFYGTKQNAENAERAKKIVACAEAVRSSCKNAVCKSRDPDNSCFPNHSTELSVPSCTNIISREINRHMATMFELADIVRISRKADNSIRFMFTVLKVWEA